MMKPDLKTLFAESRKKLYKLANVLRIDNERRFYSDNVFQPDYYIDHSWSGDVGDAISNIHKNGCYIFSMGTQQNMIKDGWLKETWSNDYRDTSIIDDWLKENTQGFYSVRGWGSGMGNHGQISSGLWHVEVYIMRKEDAMAFKLRWE